MAAVYKHGTPCMCVYIYMSVCVCECVRARAYIFPPQQSASNMDAVHDGHKHEQPWTLLTWRSRERAGILLKHYAIILKAAPISEKSAFLNLTWRFDPLEKSTLNVTQPVVNNALCVLLAWGRAHTRGRTRLRQHGTADRARACATLPPASALTQAAHSSPRQEQAAARLYARLRRLLNRSLWSAGTEMLAARKPLSRAGNESARSLRATVTRRAEQLRLWSHSSYFFVYILHTLSLKLIFLKLQNVTTIWISRDHVCLFLVCLQLSLYYTVHPLICMIHERWIE